MKPLVAVLLWMFVPASCSVAHEKEENQEMKRVLHFLGNQEPRSILVDNIRGSIHVTGYDGDSVQLVVQRTNFADTDDKLAEAREKVSLDIKEEKDRILLYVDAPWRRSDCIDYRGWHYHGYDVQFDFEIRVPSRINVYVKTVNDGEVRVEDTQGDFEVQNVNGGITMSNIAGSGKVCTVNGSLDVVFSQKPQKNCRFSTVNGKVDVEFPPDLAADLNLKTMNGNVYTDFDVVGLPPKPAVVESRGTRKIYLRDKSFTARVASGGPELSFETLNGNVHILKREN
ncbi:MAG TPA: hypothetical protein VMM37_00760 [Bacteroidota bacterium]|nr:hypothetical protein [Bacteroidota bacterium]